MSGYLIVITGCIYAYVAGEQLVRGNAGLGIAYAGYAFAAIGLRMLASR
jgi:hypothetical protein